MKDNVDFIVKLLTEFFPVGATFWIQLGKLMMGIAILTSAYTISRKILRHLRTFRVRREVQRRLHPYFSPGDIYNKTAFYIQSRCQETSPSENSDYSRFYRSKMLKTPPIMPIILDILKTEDREDNIKFILADSAMGKTTFLVNLYIKLASMKDRLINGLPFDVALVPLADPNALTRIEALPNKSNTVLLLDALDEDANAQRNYRQRLDELYAHVREFQYTIVTCRTHFFPADKEMPHQPGYWYYGEHEENRLSKLYLAPFTQLDVDSYLAQKYVLRKLSISRYLRARRIIKYVPKLSMRPLMLHFIDSLLSVYPLPTTPATIYEAYIKHWIYRESMKKSIAQRYPKSEEFQEQLLGFSKVLARELFANRGANPLMTFDPATKKLTKTDQPLVEVLNSYDESSAGWDRSQPLINRNAVGHYKFAHRSILEYMVASSIYEKNDREHHADLSEIAVFLTDMINTGFATSISPGRQPRLIIVRLNEIFVEVIGANEEDGRLLEEKRSARTVRSTISVAKLEKGRVSFSPDESRSLTLEETLSFGRKFSLTGFTVQAVRVVLSDHVYLLLLLRSILPLLYTRAIRPNATDTSTIREAIANRSKGADITSFVRAAAAIIIEPNIGRKVDVFQSAVLWVVVDELYATIRVTPSQSQARKFQGHTEEEQPFDDPYKEIFGYIHAPHSVRTAAFDATAAVRVLLNIIEQIEQHQAKLGGKIPVRTTLLNISESFATSIQQVATELPQRLCCDQKRLSIVATSENRFIRSSQEALSRLLALSFSRG